MGRIYIKLSSNDVSALENLWKNGSTARQRNRAHALLLSNQGMDINTLSSIFFVKRDTIKEWFIRWTDKGLTGLNDDERSGRPSIFSENEKKNYHTSQD